MINPAINSRFGVGVRWPTITSDHLGDDWDLIECGLPGRTATSLLDPMMGAHMNGQLGLRIALSSHKPIDVLTIMLGTNDCKAYFGLSPEGIASAVAALITIAKDPVIQDKQGGFQILLIAPPLVQEHGTFAEGLWRASEKSAALPNIYAHLAAHMNVAYLDASQHISTCAEDGVHFDAPAHQTLGNAIAAKIATL
jgi:lysophospholipase L1-like esterase